MGEEPDHGEESYRGSGRLQGKKGGGHPRRLRDRAVAPPVRLRWKPCAA
jgi:hypothetical protein